MSADEHYDRTSIALHWSAAILIVCQWLSGQTIDWFAKGAPRIDARSVHLVIGLLLIGIMSFRIWWRLSRGGRMTAATSRGWTLLAQGVQGLLYILIVAVLVGGVATELLRGDIFFGLFQLPRPGALAGVARHDLSERIGALHGLAANIILVLAGLHAAAALFHHYVLKDAVLKRMLVR